MRVSAVTPAGGATPPLARTARLGVRCLLSVS